MESIDDTRTGSNHWGEKDDQTQLVVCEDHAYHMLLHKRRKALMACGHADWRKCSKCGEYDSLSNMVIHKSCVSHKECPTAVVHGQPVEDVTAWFFKVMYDIPLHKKNIEKTPDINKLCN